jgi:tetratricopeptide (TPR) repeat protein
MRLAVSLTSLVASGAILLACSRDPQEAPPNTPGTVIFRSKDGRTLTNEDLRAATGTFRYEIIGEENVPAEAKSLHQQGREAGARGDYNRALILLERASQVAPRWPYPVYDTAYTYLLMRDYDAALKYYKKTVELSPRGFFTAITAVDTLTREQKGDLPTGTYLAYLSLEGIDDRAKKTKAVRMLVKRVPEFGPAWKELAAITDDDTKRLAIIEKGLATHPDLETKGMLQINKAIVLNLKGNHGAAIQILGDLALDPNSTFGTANSAKAALAILTNP